MIAAATTTTCQMLFITVYIPVQVDNSICMITCVKMIVEVCERELASEYDSIDARSLITSAVVKEKTLEDVDFPFSEQLINENGYSNCGLEDHLGSTRAVVDETGKVTEATMYYPYGTMVSLLPPAPGDNAREKFTGKELDAGENPISEVGFNITISNFDAGSRHWYGELYVNYLDLASNQSFLKVYEMIYDQTSKKFTLNTTERFPDNMKITHLRINTTGVTSAASINYEKDCDYTINTNVGRTISLSTDGGNLISNTSVNYFTSPTNTYIPVRVARSNLYYFGARYYDPELGIFTSPDPMDQMWNAYSYCGGDPINRIDYWGEEWSDSDNDGYDDSETGLMGSTDGSTVTGNGDGTFTYTLMNGDVFTSLTFDAKGQAMNSTFSQYDGSGNLTGNTVPTITGYDQIVSGDGGDANNTKGDNIYSISANASLYVLAGMGITIGKAWDAYGKSKDFYSISVGYGLGFGFAVGPGITHGGWDSFFGWSLTASASFGIIGFSGNQSINGPSNPLNGTVTISPDNISSNKGNNGVGLTGGGGGLGPKVGGNISSELAKILSLR